MRNRRSAGSNGNGGGLTEAHRQRLHKEWDKFVADSPESLVIPSPQDGKPIVLRRTADNPFLYSNG